MNLFRQIASNLVKGPVPGDATSGGSGGGSKPPSDADLVRRSQNGEYRAFDELVTKHRGRVYAMIQNMVKNEADAWDLSQEVFVKVWKALPKFEARARFSTWMYRITHNVVYDWMRKRKMETVGELDDNLLDHERIAAGATATPARGLRPDEALTQGELRNRIEGALDKLSPEHREAILLREVQGFEYKEIADVMECSIGTVMSRLYYARKKLQSLLTSNHEPES
jgi:RNA polymerase sigma-70 factor (ECF subfamily)